ncbi:hypothetical protein [Maribellus mangrovi]|uniref:hypothetical protein n=1 Tax=Maribellus mangrovi TaxID=3133146 RepID=UPI0030EDE9A6
MKSFIARLTALTLALALIGWLVFSMFLPEYYLPVFPFLLAFFYAATTGIHAYQLSVAKKDIGKFARSNMLITFIKLMVYSIIAVVYILIDRENAVPFVVVLMTLYLVYTFFEVSNLTRISKKDSKKK